MVKRWLPGQRAQVPGGRFWQRYAETQRQREAEARAMAPRGTAVLFGGDVGEADAQGRGLRPSTPSVLWTDGLGRAATRSLQVLLVLTLAGLVVYGTVTLSLVVIPVILALIISASSWPLIRFLTARGIPPVIATLMVLVSVLLVVGGLVTGIVFMVRSQWDALNASAIQGLGSLVDWANANFPVTIDDAQIAAWIEQVRGFLFSSQFRGAAASSVTAGLSAVGSFLTSFVLFIVVLFFFMKDGPVIWDFLMRPFSGTRERRLRLMGERAVSVLGGYVRGTVIVALVDALFIGAGLWIVGVPLAFPLAVIVFITAFIPVVGATLAGIVAALVTLVTNGPVEALIVVVIVVIVNQLEGNFLAPVVLGRSLQLHELVVLLALTVGAVLGGIIGTLLAVPVAAVTWALVKAWYEPLPESGAEPAPQAEQQPEAEPQPGAEPETAPGSPRS